MRRRDFRIPDWAIASAGAGRARLPDHEAHVDREGVRIAYEIYGEGDPTIVFFCPWALLHSRVWRAMIPYLSRRHRVIAIDARGTGRSDRPRGKSAYVLREHCKDVLAVMDATGTERAVVVSASIGGRACLWLGAERPERVSGLALIAAYVPTTAWPPDDSLRATFSEPSALRRALRAASVAARNVPGLFRNPTYRRFAPGMPVLGLMRHFHAHAWRTDQRGFVEWFMRTLAIADRHSSRAIEIAVRYGADTDAEALIDSFAGLNIADDAASLGRHGEVLDCCRRVRCPVLVIHGDCDVIAPHEWAVEIARATRGRLVSVPGAGHGVHVRKPVVVNLALHEFAAEVQAAEHRLTAGEAKRIAEIL